MARPPADHRRSRAASKGEGQSGFSLLELLVVLTIMAMVLVAAPPFFARVLPGYRLKATARALADGLRDARSDAIASNEAVTLLLTPHIGADVSGHTRRVLIPAGATAQIQVPPQNRLSQGDVIRFFADGSSSGGRIYLVDGKYHADISVSWVNGRVTIHE